MWLYSHLQLQLYSWDGTKSFSNCQIIYTKGLVALIETDNKIKRLRKRKKIQRLRWFGLSIFTR
jgi:hypothetical protein